jgi:cytochrome P450 PksS
MTHAATTNQNIASAAFKADPYPFYARLRREAPVYRVSLDRQPVWLVTRYDDVAAVLKDERFAKHASSVMSPEQLARQPWVPGPLKPLSRSMLDLDAPDHTRLRALVSRAFTPRLVPPGRTRRCGRPPRTRLPPAPGTCTPASRSASGQRKQQRCRSEPAPTAAP